MLGMNIYIFTHNAFYFVNLQYTVYADSFANKKILLKANLITCQLISYVLWFLFANYLQGQVQSVDVHSLKVSHSWL